MKLGKPIGRKRALHILKETSEKREWERIEYLDKEATLEASWEEEERNEKM